MCPTYRTGDINLALYNLFAGDHHAKRVGAGLGIHTNYVGHSCDRQLAELTYKMPTAVMVYSLHSTWTKNRQGGAADADCGASAATATASLLILIRPASRRFWCAVLHYEPRTWRRSGWCVRRKYVLEALLLQELRQCCC